MRKLLSPTLLASVAIGACGGEVMTPGVTPTPFEPIVVRAQTVSALDLSTTTTDLPGELTGSTALEVATLPGVGTLVGASTGLYELGVDGLAQIDTTPVTGLVVLDDVGIVVATGTGVSVWNGSLERSPLSDALTTMAVVSLGRRNNELWIGTDAELYVFDTDHLDAFDDTTGVRAIQTYNNAVRIVVDDLDGATRALREAADGSWSVDTIDEVALDTVVPAAGDRLFGVRDGALLERIAVGTEVAWRGVALNAAEDAAPTNDVRGTTLDSETGAVWFVLDGDLRRYTGETVEVLARPPTLGAPTSLSVTDDGALWYADGTTLSRFGHDGPNITWANDILPFAENNCNRCHVALGIAHPLDTYDAWVSEIDDIIEEVAASRMPQDKTPLVGGTAELIRRWKIGGFEE